MALAPLEIRALAKIVDELDYYQILEIQPGASRAEIKQAYYKTSRTFHPDANRSLDSELRGECERITKRISEWHGGEVTVARSDLGGAQFCLRWPWRHPNASQDTAEAA